MKKKHLIALMIGALLVISGVIADRQLRLRSVPAETWRCLQQPQQLVLYSIHPEEPELALAGSQIFHGYRILGQIGISTQGDQQHIADAVQRAVLRPSDLAACFNPRHAIHVSDGYVAYDLVICFEGGKMEIFDGDKFLSSARIGGPPDALNSILAAANIPLAPK